MRRWCGKIAESLLPEKYKVIKFHEDTPLRLNYDDGMLKLALQICINSHWTYIPSPDDIARYPSLWLQNLFRLNEEVTRQYNHIVASLEDE